MYGAGMDARERLVHSAQELMWDRGYVATSPKAIQQHAGAGQGSMYHHFSGKAELARAALEATAQAQREKADQLLAGPGTPLARLVRYLQRERDSLRGCPIGRHALDPDVVADPALRAPLASTFAWLQERLAGIVAEGQAAGEFPGDLDPGAVAATVVATVQGGYVLARSSGDPRAFTTATDGAVQLLTALSR
jgi:TetR/AcrR family transcriptional repressor of nem operon